MEIIYHRRNSINDLKSTSHSYGVEIDIRSYNSELIINHEPFNNGDKFSDWITHYKHGTLIINIKEEGLEESILWYLRKYKIKSYFFLDQSFPFILKFSSLGIMNIAVRVSEYESIDTALNLKDRISWVWVDMFEKFSLNYNDFQKLKLANFKLCLVSPELQINNKNTIDDIQKIIFKEQMEFDAVCTKEPFLWDK
tara:strand:+ start:33 stop:620 length:588 start_codon:yes stop_codon:yes gene_type:complete